MASLVPWEKFEEEYAENFSLEMGVPALPFRVALGSLIIKEKLGISDRETAEQIKENPYLQYFIGQRQGRKLLMPVKRRVMRCSNFWGAIALLKLLTCNQETQPQITEEALFARLNPEFTESQCLDALLWLEAVGLIHRDAIADKDYYQLHVPLLSRWLRMQMKPEEIQQWQL